MTSKYGGKAVVLLFVFLYNKSIKRSKAYITVFLHYGKEQLYVYDEKSNPKTEPGTEVYHASERGFLLSGINGGQGDFNRILWSDS